MTEIQQVLNFMQNLFVDLAETYWNDLKDDDMVHMSMAAEDDTRPPICCPYMPFWTWDPACLMAQIEDILQSGLEQFLSKRWTISMVSVRMPEEKAVVLSTMQTLTN